jgi:Ni,Fe-hydrogenase I cytochrome b subunit
MTVICLLSLSTIFLLTKLTFNLYDSILAYSSSALLFHLSMQMLIITILVMRIYKFLKRCTQNYYLKEVLLRKKDAFENF